MFSEFHLNFLNFYKCTYRGVQRGSLEDTHFELIYQFVCGIYWLKRYWRITKDQGLISERRPDTLPPLPRKAAGGKITQWHSVDVVTRNTRAGPNWNSIWDEYNLKPLTSNNKRASLVTSIGARNRGARERISLVDPCNRMASWCLSVLSKLPANRELKALKRTIYPYSMYLHKFRTLYWVRQRKIFAHSTRRLSLYSRKFHTRGKW